MRGPQHATDEGLAEWVERWAPSDHSVWNYWRMSLPPELRSEALFPLQAALCGLDALRSFENESLETYTPDFRDHLHAACATYAWALRLSNDLRAGSREVGMEPLRSLDELRDSLADAAHVSERLLELPVVDAGSFHSSCDMFLRELRRNEYFRPPRALELTNDAFLGLLRLHRLAGIIVRQLDEGDGGYVALVVFSAIRRDLRELTHLIASRGDEAGAKELERVVTVLEAEDMLPGSHVLETEVSRGPMRERVRELRGALKRVAKRIRGSGEEHEDEAPRRRSERVPVDLTREVWAFRLILRAFLAKTNAVLSEGIEAQDPPRLAFVGEFVGHFRAFGPRLAKGTSYTERGPLTRAVSALSQPGDSSIERLADAVAECERFVEHLESVLSERSDSESPSFDKERAAAELRGYLEAAKRQPDGLRGFG